MTQDCDDCEHENPILLGRADDAADIYYCTNCGYTIGEVVFYPGTERQGHTYVRFNEFFNRVYKERFQVEIDEYISGYISKW